MKKILTATGEENVSGACYEYRPDNKIRTVGDLINFLKTLPKGKLITINNNARGFPGEDVFVFEDGLGSVLTSDGKEILP